MAAGYTSAWWMTLLFSPAFIHASTMVSPTTPPNSLPVTDSSSNTPPTPTTPFSSAPSVKISAGGRASSKFSVLGGALVKYLGQNQRCSVATSSIKAAPADCLRQVLERCCPTPPEALSTCKVERPPQGLNRSGAHLPRPDDLLNLLADPLSSLRPVDERLQLGLGEVVDVLRRDREEQPDQDVPEGEDRVPRVERNRPEHVFPDLAVPGVPKADHDQRGIDGARANCLKALLRSTVRPLIFLAACSMTPAWSRPSYTWPFLISTDGAHVHRCQVDPLVRLGGAVVAGLAEVVDGPDAGRLHQADPFSPAPKACQRSRQPPAHVRAPCLALLDLFLGPPKDLLVDIWVGDFPYLGFQDGLGPLRRLQNLREGFVRLAVLGVAPGPPRRP